MTDPNVSSRRGALKTISSGFGYLAFAALATEQARASNPLQVKPAHFEAKAKRVIFLSMRGAPSHVDTFDYKPQLIKDTGKVGKYGGSGRLLGSPWEFRQRGKSGLWISDLFPELASQSDELCLLRGMHCDQPNHPQATTQTHTGSFQFPRPSMGAWTLYGLGTENENLPGFIVLNPTAGDSGNYASSFLPAIYQGTKMNLGGRGRGRGGFAQNMMQAADERRRAMQRGMEGGMRRGRGMRDAMVGERMGMQGRPMAQMFRDRMGAREDSAIPNLTNDMLGPEQQRIQLDLIQSLNKNKLDRDGHQPQVEGMIESFELAYRMQSEMPEAVDLSDESDETLRLYGIDGSSTDDFGRQCLMARRLAERGVRFIECISPGWDHHRNLRDEMEDHCSQIDRPIAGLLQDLKQRGLLEETLVIWAGEFGRTPHAQNGDGRDHNNKGYTTWMAGGGVRGGFSYGATDEHGYEAVDGKCHIHDWHATILHLLGLDHERLTYRYAGRDFRLTDVHGSVIKDIVG
ncbi:DUF1501 domain-containing protein [Rhodopirellula halodulae]|uniref:DUF1501 domain-containing protein n=1 Tax=Rhodopirellula halodulae TaxID=2894198 RepID=UPI001E2B0BCE|nr:DUF1501 domain-containing protein [Rhodopirellula sp. JC737]MCC9655359.1 DUF1501 domain-containing protein [Rhodopirellula sp. JC737]